MAMGLVALSFAAAEAQSAARFEYHDRNLGVAVAIGDLPVRVYVPSAPRIVWREVAWRPVRVRGHHGPPSWAHGRLSRGHLDRLLGDDLVLRMDRHGTAMGFRGAPTG